MHEGVKLTGLIFLPRVGYGGTSSVGDVETRTAPPRAAPIGDAGGGGSAWVEGGRLSTKGVG